ncbi:MULTISPECIES: universal stress protein [unclassified Rhizobium]|uniref:universal stress protein n=1 Tax=unclassified Rhizobium TaxID=2613769 RepID=UPI003D2B5957
MSYRTIVAVLDDERNAVAVTDFAAALSREFSSHVVGLHAEVLATVPLIAPMEIPDPTATQVLQQVAHTETRRIAEVFRARAESEGLSYEWRTFVATTGYGSSHVLECVRSSDLIIACQNDPSGDADNRADLETLLFDSGRPVLLVPHVMRTPQPIRRVLIAWNGSREASRAAFDALPFLQRAESVEIFCVDPPAANGPAAGQASDLAGSDLAAALSRHGVNVSLRTEENPEVSTAAAIEKRLQDDSVDLLVMGGYGNARWWEMLFGGVTRSILTSLTALTLLSR